MYEDRSPFYPQVSKPPEIILRIWENDYGVPSVDPECLILLTLLKLYRVKFTIAYGCFPLYHRIPSLYYKEEPIPNDQLHEYIKNKLCKENERWHLRHQKRIKLLKRYFKQCFVNIFLFDSWVDDSNYGYAIETWYNNVIPPPFAPKYVETLRKRILKKCINLLHGQNPQRFMLECYKVADICLRDFDIMLKNNKRYFYRNMPTSLDALIFSYLTLTLHMPLQKPQLQNMIKRHKRLVRYVKYITKKYYFYIPETFKYVDPVYPKYEPASVSSVCLAIIITGSCMFLYACTVGLLNFDIPRCILDINLLESLVQQNIADSTVELILLPFSYLLHSHYYFTLA